MKGIYRVLFFIAAGGLIILGCISNAEKTTAKGFGATHHVSVGSGQAEMESDSAAYVPEADGGSVPVLCYHQIRDWTPKDSKTAKVYIVPVASFKAEMKILHDKGYHSISPDQLIAHLQHGAPLPSKPIMITLDDADESQYSVGLPELDKAGFKATFYVMTVVLNRPKYFSKAQVKELNDKGHTIGCHTWDHHMVTKYTEADWVKQVVKPRAELEKIIGKPVMYFAYPFGLWNPAAVSHIKQYGFTAAFSLAGKADHEAPMYTLKRQIVDGNWSAEQMMKYIEHIEKGK